MIETLIADYLKDHRRIVVPELGAFLKKEDERVVFVPFLNKDDGILNQLVKQSYGASQAESVSVISQYVSSIRSAISASGYYFIKNIGTLKNDHNGIIYLDSNESQPDSQPVSFAVPSPALAAQQAPELQIRAAKSQVVLETESKSPFDIKRSEPQTENFAGKVRPVVANDMSRDSMNDYSGKPGKKADLLLIIAIIVAIIAICVMIYSYYVQEVPVLDLN